MDSTKKFSSGTESMDEDIQALLDLDIASVRSKLDVAEDKDVALRMSVDIRIVRTAIALLEDSIYQPIRGGLDAQNAELFEQAREKARVLLAGIIEKPEVKNRLVQAAFEKHPVINNFEKSLRTIGGVVHATAADIEDGHLFPRIRLGFMSSNEECLLDTTLDWEELALTLYFLCVSFSKQIDSVAKLPHAKDVLSLKRDFGTNLPSKVRQAHGVLKSIESKLLSLGYDEEDFDAQTD